MSKKVLTMDLATGKKKLETVIDDAKNAAGKEDVAYSAKAVDDKVTAINSSIDKAVINLRSNTSYQNAVAGIYKIKGEIAPVDNSRYIISTQFFLYTAKVEQVGVLGEPGYVAGKPESWELLNTASTGMTVYNLKDGREYRYEPNRVKAEFKGINETAWFDTNSQDLSIVQIAGEQTITGAKTFTANTEFGKAVHVGGNLQVDGDLTVSGTTTQIDTENLVIKDNMIILNDGDIGQGDGSGITNGAAGFTINRGKAAGGASDLAKAQIYFSEEDDLWKVGTEGDIFTIARVNDESLTSKEQTYSIDKINELISSNQDYAVNSTLFSFSAVEDLVIGDIVYLTIDGSVAKASATNLACMNVIAGVVMSNVSADEIVQVAKFGKINKFAGLEVGKPYFLGLDGKVVTAPLAESKFVCMLGSSTTTSEMLLQIGEAIEIGL